MDERFLAGDVRAIPARRLDEETCRKFGYRVGTNSSGKTVQIADYRNAEGELVAQKIRDADKNFTVVGGGKDMPLFGQHLWPASGRRVVVTEGELDALSVAQACGLSWPVTSLPNGAQGAKRAVQRALEFLEGYEQVVFCFDMDEPGRAAAVECAALLSPGRASIAELPRKDASEMLVAGEVTALSKALWNARTYRPGGIISGADLWERITARQEQGIPYPWKGLTEMTYGQRMGTLVTWTSGTGQGKSTAVAQVAYDLAFKQELTGGYVGLEEDVGRAGQRFLSHHLGKLVHLPGVATEDELRKAFDETLGTGRLWFHDHFGSADSDDLLSKLRYLIKGCGCRFIVLDHLSIVVSGMDLGADERRTIDQTMTRLRTLVEETGCLLHLVSHLRRIGEAGHEEGARVSLAHLRGSQSIAQLSDIVIGMERNQQAEGDAGRLTTIRVLKNRTSGDTGVACFLDYDKENGRLNEAEPPKEHGFKDESNQRDF